MTGWLVDWPAPHALLLACVPALALAIDRLLGEPAAAWHPVVWMGRALDAMAGYVAPTRDEQRQLSNWSAMTLAAMGWCTVAVVVYVAAALLQDWVLAQPVWLAVPALALCLKPFFSWAMLHDGPLAVEQALARSLPEARAQVAHLVSRPAQDLGADEVREAAIESLAENLNDSLVAPLFWFALLGLPGAVLYRFANTADAMWGYRGVHRGRDWRWAGKWAARADDVLSWLPARLTALLVCAVAARWPGAALWREAARTPSPNSGWPMAAMALVLGVRLGKPGAYTLNAEGRAPEPADTVRACAIGSRTTLAATLLCCAAVLWVLV
ncbi:adenosylcobinamide-phosphate synthase CbiB [Ottowia sp.]|uniref:adenosylcobinamide-phosphate synthase CbiB n=1 Tax=Ottowia sp. TaxID=1898956 RepID=UPI003A88B71C